jgi:hypothetical protein
LSNHLNGDEGIRTPDLLRAREALSQLSYIPWLKDEGGRVRDEKLLLHPSPFILHLFLCGPE